MTSGYYIIVYEGLNNWKSHFNTPTHAVCMENKFAGTLYDVYSTCPPQSNSAQIHENLFVAGSTGNMHIK